MDSDNYSEHAIKLRDAMRGIGTDEESIINLTANTKNAERQYIRQAYKGNFGRDLLDDFKSELSGDFKKVIVGMWMSQVEYDVDQIFKACDGMGTDEDTLSEIVGSRSNQRLEEIKHLYKLKHKETLEERIIDETSGDYKKLLVAIVQCKREEDNVVDNNEVIKDVEHLYKAGEGKWGTDEEVFIRIFALRSRYHLFAMNQLYKQKYKKDLLHVVASEFSGDIKILLQTILHSHINPSDYFAERIYRACKGWGTNDNLLIRSLIVTDECLLEEIKSEYPKKYGKTLRKEIEGETSGDYRKILLGLIQN